MALKAETKFHTHREAARGLQNELIIPLKEGTQERLGVREEKLFLYPLRVPGWPWKLNGQRQIKGEKHTNLKEISHDTGAFVTK